MKIGDIVDVKPFRFGGMILAKSEDVVFVQGAKHSANIHIASVSPVSPIISASWKATNPKIFVK